MFYIGCLTRTIYFLNACLDSLSFVLLFFSLIKLFIIIYFYSFLCLSHGKRKDQSKRNREFYDDSSVWRHSSSFESSSATDNQPRRSLILPRMNSQEENNNEYETTIVSSTYSPPQQRIQKIVNDSPPRVSRKLSVISEKTDDSDPDLLRNPKRKPWITTIQPTKPVIKARRRILRDDENDSGVEHSSSEKSFDGQNPKSPTALSFSKVFVTSVTEIQPTDEEVKKSLISNEVLTPKSILKKYNHPSPPTQRKMIPVYPRTIKN